MKTPETPKDVARYVTSISLLVVAVLLLPLVILFAQNRLAWLFYVLAVSGVGVSVFLTVNLSIERFIHRKIRLIYKTIHRLKTQKNADPMNFNEDILSSVNQEVLDWAQTNQQEITTLRKQEQFRKEFVGNLSHELKTPIFSIQGYLLTLLEGGLEDPSINREYLQRADKNLDRLISLINELDQITRLESGENRLTISKFDVHKLALEVVENLEYQSQQANVKLKVRDPKKQIIVEADRSKITQVFTNLIENSIKYGKENGTTQIRFYDMDENVLVEIEDDAMGIAPEHIPRLFERFYRIDKSRNRNQGGSGLGLAIVKHILDAHKQTINVRSVEGEGSTFAFTLKKVKA